MRIEFLGSAGSGKSTLMPVVIDYFLQNGANVYSRRESTRLYAARSSVGKLVKFAPKPLQRPIINRVCRLVYKQQQNKFERKHPDLMHYVYESQHNRPPEAGVKLRRVLPSFNNLIRQYGLFSLLKQPGDVFIFDEGFVHRVVYMNVSPVETPDPKRVAGYLNLIPRADCVIYVQAPAEVCMQRIIKRGLAPYVAGMDEKQMRRFFENSQTVVKLAVAHLKQRGWTIIEVDNSQDDPSPALAEMQAQLRRIGLHPDMMAKRTANVDSGGQANF